MNNYIIADSYELACLEADLHGIRRGEFAYIWGRGSALRLWNIREGTVIVACSNLSKEIKSEIQSLSSVPLVTIREGV